MPIKFSLVIPTFNERDNLSELLNKLNKTLDAFSFDSEIIVVDDNSPDMTWKEAGDLAKQNARVKLVRRMRERGLASAVVSGWKVSEGEILGVIDGDLQHPPEFLKEMIDKIIEDRDTDVVVASRYIAGGKISARGFWQILRPRLAILAGKIFFPKIFNLLKDPLSGYFILHRRVIEKTRLDPFGYKILLEVLVKGSYRKILELPYNFEKRKGGRSKAGFKQNFLFLFHFFKLRFC